VHGTKDDVIRYEGGKLFGKYPPAKETVATWARKNGCSGALVETGQQKDLDGVLPGAETSVARYEGCPAGIDVELWTIADGAHIPDVGKVWADEAFAFLLAHPKRD
jgi:polyhydroxybutyrate depolymerase